MAHTKSAKKKIRQYESQRLRNSAARSLIKTTGRKLAASVESKETGGIQQNFSALCSALDKAVKRGNLKKKTAIRRKARAARKIRLAAKA